MQQQMEQARENVQQASRAMDAGNLAEAISEGTRAEREFEELKEDFRKQTSSQFDDAVRDSLSVRTQSETGQTGRETGWQ